MRKHKPTESQKCDIIINYLKKEIEAMKSLNEQGEIITSEETLQWLTSMLHFEEIKKQILTRNKPKTYVSI